MNHKFGIESKHNNFGQVCLPLPNKYEAILLKDIANPEKANVKWEYEFKFPDLIVCTYRVKKNSIVTTLNRK